MSGFVPLNAGYTVSCILNSTYVWFRPPQCGLYSVRAQNKVERLSPVDPGISRGVNDLYPPRGYTHPMTRAIEVSHAACKSEVWWENFIGRSDSRSGLLHFSNIYGCFMEGFSIYIGTASTLYCLRAKYIIPSKGFIASPHKLPARPPSPPPPSPPPPTPLAFDQNQAPKCFKTPPPPHRLFDLQDSLDKRIHFPPQLPDFVPLRNGFYSFRAQTD